MTQCDVDRVLINYEGIPNNQDRWECSVCGKRASRWKVSRCEAAHEFDAGWDNVTFLEEEHK